MLEHVAFKSAFMIKINDLYTNVTRMKDPVEFFSPSRYYRAAAEEFVEEHRMNFCSTRR